MSLLFSPIREFFKKGDRMLLFFALLASGYGLLLIYSATQYLDNDRFIRFMLVQTAAIFLGVVAYMLLTLVDFRLFTEKNWRLLLAFNRPWNGKCKLAVYPRFSGGYSAKRDRQATLHPSPLATDHPDSRGRPRH